MQEDTGGKKFFPTPAAWQEGKIKAKEARQNNLIVSLFKTLFKQGSKE